MKKDKYQFCHNNIKDFSYDLNNSLTEKEKIIIANTLGEGGDWTFETELMKKWMKSYIKDHSKYEDEAALCQAFKLVIELFKQQGY